MTDSDREWTHNVQIVRLELPAMEDGAHHEAMVDVAAEIGNILQRRFGQGVVSCTGFYRADSNWDNVDTPDACVNHPTRGVRDGRLDNEP